MKDKLYICNDSYDTPVYVDDIVVVANRSNDPYFYLACQGLYKDEERVEDIPTYQ